MLTRAIVIAVSCSALAFGCGTEPQSSDEDTQEIIDNLRQAGFPESDIQVVDGNVYTGLDALVTLEASREMLVAESGEEQYRTTNTVSRTLATICVNGAAFVSNAKFNDALNRAIANYNALGLTFRMTRTTSSTGCTATITARFLQGVTGGSSGFPSGGRPFTSINIGTGL
jgi:hypothetical protein